MHKFIEVICTNDKYCFINTDNIIYVIPNGIRTCEICIVSCDGSFQSLVYVAESYAVIIERIKNAR